MSQHQDWNTQNPHSYSGASYATQATAPSMNAYSSYPSHYSAGGQGGYSYSPGNMLSPISNHGASSSLSMSMPGLHGSSGYNQPPGSGYGSHHHSVTDNTGQIQPTGCKPKVTATLWEDEGTICFQVESGGLCVARREDNHFINGTKLLNVAGMTRGRRDGILKSEKTRNVVKIGPMHLKGVWIPFERALEFANREKITEKLYPLFVHNIGNLIPNQGQNGNRNGGQLARGKMGQPGMGPLGPAMVPSMPHHSSMQLPSQLTSRPGMERSHTFPTPPTSASSVVPSSSEYWNGQSMSSNMPHAAQPLNVDTGIGSNARSMPSTPATTPPGHVHSMSHYSHQQPPSGASYSSQYTSSNGYMKNEMGPPTRSTTVPSNDSKDVKQDPFTNGTSGHETAGHDQNGSYGQSGNTFGNGSHNAYNFDGVQSVPQMPPMQSEPSDQMNGSAHHDTSTGQITPRASVGHESWGYQTPPRTTTFPRYPSTLIGTGKRVRDEDESFEIDGGPDSMKRRKSLRDDMNAPRPGMMPVGR